MCLRTHELPPNAGRVINSLRDAGYNFNTAVADIVDNSVSAGATQVHIVAICSARDGQIDVSIADNGTGMSPKEVLNAMRYGSDEREDGHSLGKFGLGLKTASTSQCRRVSVISKRRTEANPFKLVLDIDHAQKTNRWEYLEEPVLSMDRQLLDRCGGTVAGTLVRWEKCDRVLPRKYARPGGSQQQAAFKKKLDDLRFHLSIVFQRFIDKKDGRARNVDILLNTTPVKPWDPFCRSLSGTEELGPKEIIVEEDHWSKRSFVVDAFVVPNRDEVDNEYDVFPKGISPDRLQGIYVYRENRLIHWGDWCRLRKVEFHHRLCRVELSFDSDLDELFNVDFKKSQIQIEPGLGEQLMSGIIEPARSRANERYRGHKTSKHSREADALHARANTDIKRQVSESRKYHVEVLDDGSQQVTTERGTAFIETKPVLKESKGRGIIPVESLPDDVLWQPRIAEDPSSVMRTSVEVNLSHPFYSKVYSLCRNDAPAIKALDYLLWSLANAEYAAKDQSSLENFEEMRREVSRNLRRLAEDLPNPDNF